ncbi:MAG: DNA-binding response regulator [Bacteroidetes bacterium CG23_combo_of_CG06-09_8_20_14_all_32_9]|nr:MAG: DNA-binding response regulator [Bacteroidetes bacterium CG23_combo_of_CG06-09_8_20_14_all_32_9]
MLKTIIIDDENRAVQTLQIILSEYCPQVSVVNKAYSAPEGIKLISLHKPDLIFLDIEMPNGTGFDVLEAFPNRTFDVIFVTAYNNYALKAIKFSAADYILKPVDIEEVVESVKRISERRNQPGNTHPDINGLLHNIKNLYQKKISVPTFNGTEYISTDEILYFEADRSYCKIFFAQKRNILISRSLSALEQLLPTGNFVKIHKSHIVNLAAVKKNLRTDGGIVELTDGTQLLIAKTKKENFLASMQRYIKENKL